jgi:hypothetical protein
MYYILELRSLAQPGLCIWHAGVCGKHVSAAAQLLLHLAVLGINIINLMCAMCLVCSAGVVRQAWTSQQTLQSWAGHPWRWCALEQSR